jgi:hypothetical protein
VLLLIANERVKLLLTALFDEIADLEVTVTVDRMYSVQSLLGLENKMSDALSALVARVENANATLSIFADQVDKKLLSLARSQSVADCSANIFIAGLVRTRTRDDGGGVWSTTFYSF